MSKQTETGMTDAERRAEEQQVFRQVTEDLIVAGSAEDRNSDFYTALDRNRSLWSALRKDVMSRANRLPRELCEQIDQLGEWVEVQTARVVRGEGRINTLIVVNRNLIDGLT
jgi:flagellar biosynthesis regulator FlaF